MRLSAVIALAAAPVLWLAPVAEAYSGFLDYQINVDPAAPGDELTTENETRCPLD